MGNCRTSVDPPPIVGSEPSTSLPSNSHPSPRIEKPAYLKKKSPKPLDRVETSPLSKPNFKVSRAGRGSKIGRTKNENVDPEGVKTEEVESGKSDSQVFEIKALEFPDGSRYEGEVFRGRLEGRGKFFFESGNVYRGDWIGGKMQGQGTLNYADGRVYEGQFWQDFRHGEGRLLWLDGRVFEGRFVQGVREGPGVETFPDGTQFRGFFLRDTRNGPGRLIRSGEVLLDGIWENGKLSSEFRNEGADPILDSFPTPPRRNTRDKDKEFDALFGAKQQSRKSLYEDMDMPELN